LRQLGKWHPPHKMMSIRKRPSFDGGDELVMRHFRIVELRAAGADKMDVWVVRHGFIQSRRQRFDIHRRTERPAPQDNKRILGNHDAANDWIGLTGLSSGE